MRFDEIKIYHVGMPLIEPWITSYGSDYEIHSILINVKNDNYSAWSETCALELPTYSYESANSIFFNISEIFTPLFDSFKSIAATSSQSEEFNTEFTTSLPILPKAPETSTGIGFLEFCFIFFKKFF